LIAKLEGERLVLSGENVEEKNFLSDINVFGTLIHADFEGLGFSEAPRELCITPHKNKYKRVI